MIDYQATAAALYPSMAQNAPAVPPGEAKATSETPGTKDTTTNTTTAQTTTTEPNSMAYALTLPHDAVLDASAIERTTAFAKASGLSPEMAQKALEHANGEVAAYREHVDKEWTTLTQETWVTETKADPEVGGEKYDDAVTDAKRFLEKYADDEALKFLDDTRLGNNRFVIRMLARAEKGLTNHRRLTSGPGGVVEHKTAAQKTYPYMNP
jgi:hypothetical protein